ncbi:MAG TPA: FG-GAP repeat protein, partial [Chthoniobacterales bacterium]|nr:FG-GAP repeat protein [Chthoniobacterales bacterium]
MRDPDENGSHVRGLRTLITSAAIGIAVLYCSDRSIAAIFHTPSGLVTAVSFVRAQLWPEENNSTSVTSTSGVKAGSGITISTAKADSARRSITANRVGLQSAHAVAQKLLPATPALLPDNFDSNASLRASNAMFNSVIASPLLRQRRSDATLPVPEAALVTPTKADNNGVTKPASGGGSAQLIASDGAAGDQFGRSVSFSGNSALAGAWRDNSSQGSAYLFRNLDTASGTITQNVKLTASDGAAFDYFGYSVSLSGNSALVGAYGDGIGSNSFQGSAYLFRNLDTASGTITQNVKLTASDGAASDLFGYSVSLSGNSALAGAYGDNSYQGSAYLFRNLDTASG